MSEEFSQADVKRVVGKHVTLKNLEAYKRLQLIKKNNEPASNKKLQSEMPYHYETSAIEKESIRNFLEPNYLPKLLNKNIIDTYDTKKSFPNDLVSRIEESLSMVSNKKANA